MLSRAVLCLATLAFLATPTFAMNKAELIDAIAKDTGLAADQVEVGVDVILRRSTRALAKGQAVTWAGIGTFTAADGSVTFSPDAELAVATYDRAVTNFWLTAAVLLGDDLTERSVNPIYTGNENEGENPLYDGSRMTVAQFAVTAAAEALRLADPQELLSDSPAIRARHLEVLETRLVRAAKVFTKQAQLEPLAASSLIEFIDQAVDAVEQQAEEVRNAGSSGEVLRAVTIEEMLTRVARKAKITQGEARLLADSFFDIIFSAVATGEVARLGDFGSLKTPAAAARTGRNPQTGKEIKIAAKKVVKFKAGADLSKKVN